MVDISAKWKNILTEESKREVANVSLPSETVEEIMTTDIPTPGIPVSMIKSGTPGIIEDPTKIFTSGVLGLIGTREEKAKTLSSWLPIDIETRTTVLPTEYKVQYEHVEIPDLNISYEKPVFPESVIEGEEQIHPGDIQVISETQGIEDLIGQVIDIQKEQSEELKNWWETGTLGATNITLPEFNLDLDLLGGIGDALAGIGKYALLFGALILGIFILKR